MSSPAISQSDILFQVQNSLKVQEKELGINVAAGRCETKSFLMYRALRRLDHSQIEINQLNIWKYIGDGGVHFFVTAQINHLPWLFDDQGHSCIKELFDEKDKPKTRSSTGEVDPSVINNLETSSRFITINDELSANPEGKVGFELNLLTLTENKEVRNQVLEYIKTQRPGLEQKR